MKIMENTERKFEEEFEIKEEKEPAIFTVATKEGNFSFGKAPFEKLSTDKKIAEDAFNNIEEIAGEENKFFEKFSENRKIIEEIIMDTEGDNYFTLEGKEEKPRGIKFPGTNNEILKTTELTKPIIRHEAFHQAMKLENYRYQIEMQKNIEEGKDTKLPFFEKEIKTSKFREFVKQSEYGKSFLDVMVVPNSTKPDRDIQKLIEEKIADFYMAEREISKKGIKKGAEAVINAKIKSLDIIAKNKELKDYKELPTITESYYGLINGRNTLISLKKLNEKTGNKTGAEEFDKTIKKYEDKIKGHIKEQERFREVIGYEGQESLEKTNEKFLKSFDNFI